MSNDHNNAVPSALRDFASLPDDAHVRQPVVEQLYACSSSTVWRGVRTGRIPQPKKLSPGVTAWRVGDLRAALAAAS